MAKIGKLEKTDLRELWEGEATEFTPWLAQDENILQLSNEIGLDLEVISEEKKVGPFKADILCRDTIDDSFVLVENQLERTDHIHLGQLMTYAAGLDAVTIVWIAKAFTDEHRAAMDWLNRITDENIRFFGIEIEAYRIGNSLPAPYFQIVSKPNDWSKSVQSSKRNTELTDTQINNLRYWTAMREYFDSSGTKIKSQKPSPQHWTHFSIGKSYFHISAVHSFRDSMLRVSLIIDGTSAKERFDKLQESYEELSKLEISQEVIWDKLEERKVSIVYLEKSAEVGNKVDWSNQFEWILEYVEKFDKFFRSKIKNF